jgi:hypothetical protein
MLAVSTCMFPGGGREDREVQAIPGKIGRLSETQSERALGMTQVIKQALGLACMRSWVQFSVYQNNNNKIKHHKLVNECI